MSCFTLIFFITVTRSLYHHGHIKGETGTTNKIGNAYLTVTLSNKEENYKTLFEDSRSGKILLTDEHMTVGPTVLTAHRKKHPLNAKSSLSSANAEF